MKIISLPLSVKVIATLKAGDSVLLSGALYAARDAAHKRMVEALDSGEALPFDIKGQTIYYVGPSPAPTGKVIGAAGLKGMIGKGPRSAEVRAALKKYKAVYFGAIGGTGALLSRLIVKSEVVAYPELGPEAVLKLEVKNFPVTVINDIFGGDLYEEGRAKYRA